MKKNEFAQKNGFSSYMELIISSKVLFKDNNAWLVTRTEHGFLAWVDKSLDKPLGYFDTFDLARQEIIDTIIINVST